MLPCVVWPSSVTLASAMDWCVWPLMESASYTYCSECPFTVLCLVCSRSRTVSAALIRERLSSGWPAVYVNVASPLTGSHLPFPPLPLTSPPLLCPSPSLPSSGHPLPLLYKHTWNSKRRRRKRMMINKSRGKLAL